MRKGHVLDEGLGPSYYRPEKAHQKKGPKKRSEVEDLAPREVPPVPEGPATTPDMDMWSGTTMGASPEGVTEEPERPAPSPPPSSEVDEIEEWGDGGFEGFEEMEELEEVEEWGE
jgi:hypothetical protein